MRIPLMLLAALALAACDAEEEETAAASAVRGLKTFTVEAAPTETLRRFPGALAPVDITALAFETGGRLGPLDLDVGRKVTEGEELARLDPETFRLQVESAEAARAEAAARAEEAAEAAERQATLLKKGSTTRVAADQAATEAEAAAAALAQAEAALKTAQDALTRTVLKAPFDGIIASVEASPYAAVSAGTAIVTVYSAEAFEVAFSVSFDVAERLVIGAPASARLADRPELTAQAVVAEVGARAESAASFPVRLRLTETHPLFKAGMPVEAAVTVPLRAEKGLLVPLAALIKEGEVGARGAAAIWLYDDAAGAVTRRAVRIGGIRENMVIVTEGLAPGDRIAAAGVSFLREGMAVKPLSAGN